MTQKIHLLFLFLWLLVIPTAINAQFSIIDWSEYQDVDALPQITEELPLPHDFINHKYSVRLEFPEFETLNSTVADKLKDSGVDFPNYPQLTTSQFTRAGKGYINVRFTPIVKRFGFYQRINSFKLTLVSTPQKSTIACATSSEELRVSVLAKGRFVKIRVGESGVYQLTNAELKRMGFNQPHRVRLYGYGGNLLSEDFSQPYYDDLPQIPLHRLSDKILFYACGPISWQVSDRVLGFTRIVNPYSTYGYYFLTESDLPETGFITEDATIEGDDRITIFDAYTLYERDQYNWLKSGREMYDGYDYANGNSQTYKFTLPDVTNEDAYVTVAFTAKSATATTYTTSVNQQELGSHNIMASTDAYVKAVETVGVMKWQGDKTEATTLTLKHNRPSGVSGRLNYITINYQQMLRLRGATLAFRSLATKGKVATFQLSGANENTLVWDVTSPTEVKQMQGRLDGTVYHFTPTDNENIREFIALNIKENFKSVEVVGEVSNQNLHGMEAVDMVIITPDRNDLFQQAERLAQSHRVHQRLKVIVVTASQVYNEFSSGTPDATAYRRLMKMLYDRATTVEELPRYLLLFGDCSYDNRMLSSAWSSNKPSDFLLSYQSINSLDDRNSYLTDDYFGFLDNNEGVTLSNDRLDIAVGRIPVRNVYEAKTVVDKTIEYIENRHAGAWKRTVCFVGDDADGDNSDNTFMQHAIDLADSVQLYSPHIRVERILADAYKREASSTGYRYPEANRRLMQLFNQGMLLVNYTGHSNTTSWSEEHLLNTDHINKMNSPRLPIWYTASCEFTRFDDTTNSGGEIALLRPKGGAIALISSARIVYDTPNYHLHRAFLNKMFKRKTGERICLGDVLREAKSATRYLQSDGNKLNFNLTGDPALPITLPEFNVVVDELNGLNAESDLPLMQAGAKVTVKGRIVDGDGQPATDFSGTIHPLVLDSKERIYTLDNVGEGAVHYEDHLRTLFAGTDSVKQGEFKFTFPVPLDINYSNAQGMMKFYALATTKQEAGGWYNNFGVGGTSDDIEANDNGPTMMLYLNTPDFMWGGKVNETPYFVAELTDVDGINTVGNGIGHDLMLTIDGKQSYNLNDYYQPLAGNYTRGRVAFSIPSLTEGKHQLSFRAWDLLNNSTTKVLDFEVVNGLRPDLLTLTCTDSPARTATTFILSHNRPDSELDVQITVCDMNGRELWVHTERGVASGEYYTIDWNLCSNGGQRLWPGIYLYRASIVSGGSKADTKSEKILILSQ